jgi:hypothetical protein
MEKITVCSTGWQHFDINAVANFKDDIKIGECKKDNLACCYTKRLQFDVPREEWKAFYALARHIEGDCDEDVCIYCQSREE